MKLIHGILGSYYCIFLTTFLCSHFFYAVSCYSIFPLLFKAQEYPIKVVLLLLHSILIWLGFSALFANAAAVEATLVKRGDVELERNASFSTAAREGEFTVNWLEKGYLVGMVIVEIWGQFLHPLFLDDKLPFVPLMLISVYCTIGVMYSWIWQLKLIVRSVDL